jgi:superfamily II DNA or RNA helicase
MDMGIKKPGWRLQSPGRAGSKDKDKIMQFELKDKVILTGITTDTAYAIRQRLTIENPAYVEAEKQGRWTGGIPRTLEFFESVPGGLACPRGAAVQLHNICSQHGEQIQVEDNRLELDPVEFEFHGTLRPYQADVVTNALERDHGTLSAPTGSGKTCMGLFIIAQRKQSALIICHTKELLNQWVSAIEKFLGIPADEVGIIGGGKFSIGDRITVALVQSLYRRVDEVVPHIGHIIVDECHRAPSRTFTEAVTAFPAKYRLGLTATPWRRDGLSRVIFWYVGDVTGQVEKSDLLDNGSLVQAEVVFIPTGCRSWVDPAEYYSTSLSELTQDQQRNRLICHSVTELDVQGIILILSDRTEHCRKLSEILRDRHNVQAAVLTGQTPAKDREQIIQDLRSGRCHCLVATGQLIGEGFDLPGISTLVLSTPVKFSGRLIQYIGRALRPSPGKDKALILDLVDDHGVFQASARGREQVYRQQGIRVNESLQVGAA